MLSVKKARETAEIRMEHERQRHNHRKKKKQKSKASGRQYPPIYEFMTEVHVYRLPVIKC